VNQRCSVEGSSCGKKIEDNAKEDCIFWKQQVGHYYDRYNSQDWIFLSKPVGLFLENNFYFWIKT
jgi:hypothetical protein